MPEHDEPLTVSVELDASGFKKDLAALRKASEGFGASLSRSFAGAIFQGRKLSDVMRSLALSLSRRALSSALRPLEQGLGGLFGQLVQGAVGSAKGNLFSQGRLVPFARGGVVAGPAAFPLVGGRVGLMGEAGPEAILPLARGRDGKLGVQAGSAGRTVNITVNITTRDAESFQRSKSQVSSLIARAAERGSRNL